MQHLTECDTEAASAERLAAARLQLSNTEARAALCRRNADHAEHHGMIARTAEWKNMADAARRRSDFWRSVIAGMES